MDNCTTTYGEYSTAAAEEQVTVISDSEEEDDDDGIVEILDGSPQPHTTLPPEVWAMVINCEYCTLINCNIFVYVTNILMLYRILLL